MITKEKLETFCEKFDSTRVEEYTKFIISECDKFEEYLEIADKMKRSSKEFQNLTSYHIAALQDENYNQFYQSAVQNQGK